MGLSAGDRKRQQILEAALQTIAKEGVDAVTHRRVGEEAAVSHGVVSYHFATRDELIYKSFEYFLGNVDEYVERIGWKVDNTDSVEKLLSNLALAINEELEEKWSTKVELELILYASRQPELADLYNEWEQTVVDKLSSHLKQLHYKRPKEIARIFVSLGRGFLLECVTNPTLTEKHYRQRAKLLLSSFSRECTR